MLPSSHDSNISGRLLQPTESLSSLIVILESVWGISFTKSESGFVVTLFLLLLVSSFCLGSFVNFLSFSTLIINKSYDVGCVLGHFTLVGVSLDSAFVCW